MGMIPTAQRMEKAGMSEDMPARLFTMPPSNGRQHAVT